MEAIMYVHRAVAEQGVHQIPS